VTSRNQALLFARNFLRYPKVLGSVVPSSRFLVDRLLRHVDWTSARLIVEYGPGVGTFTGEILRRMRPDALLVAIELNDQFVEVLAANFPDPRLRVVRGSALEVDTFLRELERCDADAIVSGIPFSTISLDLRDRILSKTYDALGPGGRFLVYQFSRAVVPHLRENFEDVAEEFVPFNILPARVYCCTK
jgi:phospholipid N-methyltransferase